MNSQPDAADPSRHTPTNQPAPQIINDFHEDTTADTAPRRKLHPRPAFSQSALDLFHKSVGATPEQIAQSLRNMGGRGDEQSEYRFKRVGGVWHIRCETDVGDFSDSDFAALKYIAKIFAKPPHTPVPVTDLYAVRAMPADRAIADRAFDTDGRNAINGAERRLVKEINEAVEAKAEARAQELAKHLEQLRDARKRDTTIRGKARRLKESPAEKAADCVRKSIAALKAAFIARGLNKIAAHVGYIRKTTTNFTYRPPRPWPAWTVSL